MAWLGVAWVSEGWEKERDEEKVADQEKMGGK